MEDENISLENDDSILENNNLEQFKIHSLEDKENVNPNAVKSLKDMEVQFNASSSSTFEITIPILDFEDDVPLANLPLIQKRKNVQNCRKRKGEITNHPPKMFKYCDNIHKTVSNLNFKFYYSF